MAKKIKFESFKYLFLLSASKKNFQEKEDLAWSDFLAGIHFFYENGSCVIRLPDKSGTEYRVDLKGMSLYTRGDRENHFSSTNEAYLGDPVKKRNEIYVNKIISEIASIAGYNLIGEEDCVNEEKNQIEKNFHDAWAMSEDLSKIDVKTSNEVCTAPEMRYITKKLGNIKGKSLLDVGCGLGEASVYFALMGADVTSSDLSPGMLDVTYQLAKSNNVSIKKHLASAEDVNLNSSKKFDIIYAGNLLHHVDIDITLQRLKKHLRKGGVFVSWDPLAYNPAINIYRGMAVDVRTPDEHPLTLNDLKTFKKHFHEVETKYFWFFTLIIFVIMALVQKRNPSQERFWKVVIAEGEKWKWLYKPLELLDKIILTAIPPLRLLCWNVVIFAKNPK